MLNGRKRRGWERVIAMLGGRAVLSVIGAVVLGLGLLACEADNDGDSGPSTTPQTTEVLPDEGSTPGYGDACALGSLPDCIDPNGDGQGTYLRGGGDCVRRSAESPELCNDLDGDGTAGYPDSG
jgi:hypothetical protein